MPNKHKKRKALRDLCDLKRKFERLERTLTVQDSSSSSESSEFESEDSRSPRNRTPVEPLAQEAPQQQPDNTPAQEAPQLQPENTPAQEPVVNDLQFLGEGPRSALQTGPDLHEELVARWSIYLREGLSAEARKELVTKFPIPSNCLALQPPKLNEEVDSILALQVRKNDRYMLHLQEQMGASLSAMGSILNSKLLEPNLPLTLDETKLQTLAEAAQLLASSFHAISVKRKFDIQPFLSQESRSASYKSPIDDFLFGSGFLDQFKACQNVRKAAEEIKKPKQPFTLPSSSLGPREHLNSKRPNYKTKKKRSPSPKEYRVYRRRDQKNQKDHQDHHQKYRKWRPRK